MKNWICLLPLALVLLTSSCVQDETVPQDEFTPEMGPVVLTLYRDGDAATKGTLDGLTPKWAVGDQIWICVGTSGPSVTYELKEGDIKDNVATITPGLSRAPGAPLYAVYPASAHSGVTQEGKIGITIPDETDGDFASAHIAVAKTSVTAPDVLYFKNAVTLLKMTVPEGFEQILFFSQGSSCGAFDVTYADELTFEKGSPTDDMFSLYVPDMTLNVGVNYVPVLPGALLESYSYSKTDGHVYFGPFPSEQTLECNKIYDLGAVEQWPYTMSW